MRIFYIILYLSSTSVLLVLGSRKEDEVSEREEEEKKIMEYQREFQKVIAGRINNNKLLPNLLN